MCSLEKRGNIFVLTLTGDNQHRLGPTLIDTLLSTVSQLSSQATPGTVLITTAHGRFFSNGFDLTWARSAASPSAATDRLLSMVESLRPVAAALMSLPMPTIAAVNGHASAAGFMLAVCHDYILMRSDHGVLYMPEVHLALPLPDYFATVMRAKIRSPAALRDVLLRGVKVTAEEGVKMGIVDSAHDSAESTLDAAVRLGEELAGRKWVGEVYAEIRKSLYPEACGILGREGFRKQDFCCCYNYLSVLCSIYIISYFRNISLSVCPYEIDVKVINILIGSIIRIYLGIFNPKPKNIPEDLLKLFHPKVEILMVGNKLLSKAVVVNDRYISIWCLSA